MKNISIALALVLFASCFAKADNLTLYCGDNADKYDASKAEIALVSIDGKASLYLKGKKAKDFHVSQGEKGTIYASNGAKKPVGNDIAHTVYLFSGECDSSAKVIKQSVGGYAGTLVLLTKSCVCEEE